MKTYTNTGWLTMPAFTSANRDSVNNELARTLHNVRVMIHEDQRLAALRYSDDGAAAVELILQLQSISDATARRVNAQISRIQRATPDAAE